MEVRVCSTGKEERDSTVVQHPDRGKLKRPQRFEQIESCRSIRREPGGTSDNDQPNCESTDEERWMERERNWVPDYRHHRHIDDVRHRNTCENTRHECQQG